MAQVFTDFTEYTVGQAPDDWTAWVAANISELVVKEDAGERYLNTFDAVDPLSEGRRFYTWDKVPAAQNIEVYYEIEETNYLSRGQRAVARLDPNKNTGEADSTALLIGPRSQDGQLQATEYVDGTPSSGDVSFTFDNYTRYAVLVTVSGSTGTVKIWDVETTEPASPQFTHTIAEPAISGLSGLGCYRRGWRRIYNVGFGTDGDPAPRTAISGPTVTLDGTGTLTPGSTVSGTATNFSSDPTSVTVSDGTNSISSSSEITDFSYDSGDNSWTFTMPSDPGLDEGSVTVDLGEASATATYDDGVTAGLSSFTLSKDGTTLGNLTGIKCLVVAGTELDGTEIYSANDLIATSGVMADIDLSATSASVGDTVTVSVLTTDNQGIVFTTTVEDLEA